MGRGRNRRVVVTGHGGPDVLGVVTGELPRPGRGEVRVAVRAAGVSAFDLMYRRWRWLPGRPRPPFTLGQDIVGDVDELGEGVTTLVPGQRVAGATWAKGLGGGYADSICLPASELVPVPPGVDPAEAVCVVVDYLMAHQHLHAFGRAQRGERLLVHGATGGVGSALLQLGTLAGLELYGTASPERLEVVAHLGATPIDRNEDLVPRIRALTVDGVDVVVDSVGGARLAWDSYRCLRPGGRLVWLGSAATKTGGLRVGLLTLPVLVVLNALPDGKRAPMIPDVGRYSATHPAWYRETLATLLRWLAEGMIKPMVAARVPLPNARHAHELLERGGVVGKIVLVTDG
jgi:NADPH:quinone reductase-like Zn-dependent oxidoreductase